MGMDSTQQPAPDYDGAVKIGNVVHLLGVLTAVGGVLAAFVAVGTGAGVGLAFLLAAAGVVSGFTLMALGAITKMTAHTARQSSRADAS